MGAAEDYAAAAKAFREKNWQNGGTTVTPTTEGQNLAAVANQPGNTSGAVAVPYITPTGSTDYHINGGSYVAPTVPNKVEPPSTGMSSTSTTTPSVTTPTVNTGTTTPQTGLYQDPFARSREDIAKLAADRIAKILQAGRTSANGALTGAKNAYDYTNQIEGDNRTLRNASLKESANPFGGTFGYQAAMNNRNDSIQDTAQDKDYNAAVGQINQKLADLEAAAPGDEQAIIDQLEQIERQTGINVAQLQEQQKQNQLNQSNYQQTFNYNAGQDSIKNGQSQQVIDYNQDPNNPANQGQVLNNQNQSIQNQIAQLQLKDYPTQSQANATLLQQQVAAGKLSNEAATYNLQQLKDPKSTMNQAADIDLQLKKLDLKNAPETARLQLQQLQKQIAEIGKVHTTPQSAADIAADQVKLATATKQLADIQNGIYPGDKSNQPQTAETYSKYLDSVAQYTKDPDTGASVLSNPDAVESAILTSGMSEYEMFRSYKAKGLPWSGPIPSAPGK